MRPPGEGLAVAYTQSAKWKETHWERPDYDELLLKANTTVDADERTKLFQQTGQLLASEGGVVLPMFVHQVLALRADCDGYTPLAQNFNLNFEDLSCEEG
jgi:peptide/nickel transport system substrate-binding protein